MNILKKPSVRELVRELRDALDLDVYDTIDLLADFIEEQGDTATFAKAIYDHIAQDAEDRDWNAAHK